MSLPVPEEPIEVNEEYITDEHSSSAILRHESVIHWSATANLEDIAASNELPQPSTSYTLYQPSSINTNMLDDFDSSDDDQDIDFHTAPAEDVPTSYHPAHLSWVMNTGFCTTAWMKHHHLPLPSLIVWSPRR
ncbi:hypothetical protein BC939DRAFT_501007 [Gamsiella multidivaricata]|uniref:uncharacterized protein n=1 Tax=Gamsiella multidivaricata TaxID=101098 RepID=UPI002220A51C|nr:uncharacterized protein BC939DRAFT_501007 [Gamsiella multidivaricata]KAI7828027.1 hypothetical protein BC939DRAFT_501007 [Gamsiella multidivaricata]